jgi:formylglycine-generating enzyme required for sulfatase activity
MSGNVWEWVFDRAAPYGNAPLDNPAGPAEGSSRILKGGSFSSEWVACRISNRMFIPDKNTKGTFGFRLAI